MSSDEAQPPAYRVGPYGFTATDARRTFQSLGELWRMHVHGLDQVPDAATVTAVAIASRLAEQAETERDARASADDPGGLLDAAGSAAASATSSGRWPAAIVELELDAAWHGLRAVADALRAAGAYGARAHGSVVQLNVSGGGVPKRPIPTATVTWAGIDGDRQAARQHHGRPWQALCLWSAEVVDAFAADGHPLAYGAAGENVTVRGLDWSRMRPGAHLRVGEVECQVSAYALPCSKNARWFRNGAFDLMHHTAGPVSRVYATVTSPGRVDQGDDVVFEA
jgi:hypothetical protein